ncbi:MAG: hypothetical protein LBD67_05585 [Candidatus Accumulibacter sp.]|jgi:hypothetical protein|nr:hypothetical protein [Accumulibacter sp.]
MKTRDQVLATWLDRNDNKVSNISKKMPFDVKNANKFSKNGLNPYHGAGWKGCFLSRAFDELMIVFKRFLLIFDLKLLQDVIAVSKYTINQGAYTQ